MGCKMDDYIVFVNSNASGYITEVNSSAFLPDTTGWVAIDRGNGDKYHHAQNKYLPQPLRMDGGAWRYKLVDGKPVECTAEEIAAQEEALKPVDEPTQEDRIEAQVMYTALMTDTLLDMEV